MAFRALLFSKSAETNAAMTAACKSTGIRVEACSDIFSAIEKAKNQHFSCLIEDWAEQPEASFLLKRARESESNRDTLAIAIVDNEPAAAEMRDNRLDFLIYRPIADEEAAAVLAKACEGMQPSSDEEAAETAAEDNNASSENASPVSSGPDTPKHGEEDSPSASVPELYEDDSGEYTTYEEEPRGRHHAFGLREALAAVLALAAVFCLWRSREVFSYLSRTPEGKFHVLRASVAALFYSNQNAALPIAAAGSDAQQDAYFSRVPAKSNAPAPSLGVVATESTLPELRLPLRKAPDFPLPVPVFERPVLPPVHVEHAAIPDSMRNSAPIERPVVVTVNPAQMMPVSAPQPQPAIQQFSEPVAMSEEAARARLIHSVNPDYPPEALAKKLHGPVVLQAVIGRDGSVEDLKLIRGYFALGRAAIAAVKQWQFQPYSLGGHAASTQTVITINF